VGVLWQHFALLSEVIEKAASLDSKQSILYNPEDDIRKLFEETLIVIDRSHVDINERNLLQDETNEKVATPKSLLKHMQETFESLCRDITEISNAEEALQSRLGNIKIEIKRLNSTIGHLGIKNMPKFEINRVTEVERDPLQGMIELDKLVYSIEKYRASIKELEDDYNWIVNSFDRVRAILCELKELATKSKDAIIKSREVFSNTESDRPVISEEVLKSLQDWLGVLEMKLTEGALKAVKIGVSKLEEECSQKLERERESYEVNSRAYNEWLDLKGQFKAMLAKAEILKSRGLLIDNSLNELIENTNTALHGNPVNLDDCRQFIKKFKLSL
jgi:chromosome segregation ATPase